MVSHFTTIILNTCHCLFIKPAEGYNYDQAWHELWGELHQTLLIILYPLQLEATTVQLLLS